MVPRIWQPLVFVSPLVVVWLRLLGNTAGMDQKDSVTVVVAVAYGFAGFALRAVFLLSVSGPDALHHGRYGPDTLLFS